MVRTRFPSAKCIGKTGDQYFRFLARLGRLAIVLGKKNFLLSAREEYRRNAVKFYKNAKFYTTKLKIFDRSAIIKNTASHCYSKIELSEMEVFHGR